MKIRSRLKQFFDRSFSGKWWEQITMLLILLAGLVFLLWVIGLIIKSPEETAGDYLHKILGYFFDSNAFHRDTDSVTLTFHPLLSLILTSFGMILLGGVLISVIVNIWERHVDKIKAGDVTYHFTNHYVILGFNNMSIGIIKQIYMRVPDAYIVLQTKKEAEKVRRQLQVELPSSEMTNITVIHGSAHSNEDIDRLHLPESTRVIVLGDDDTQSHDSQNIECIVHIIRALQRGKKRVEKLRCDVLFNNQTTFTILQKIEISKNKNTDWYETIDFRPFNFQEAWAQKVIVYNRSATADSSVTYTPLDRNGIDYDSTSTVRVVIIGMNSMGVAMGVEAARTMHFPNFIRDKSKKTKITFIDSNASQEMNFFVSRYSRLFEIAGLYYADVSEEQLHMHKKTEFINTELEYDDFLDVEFSFIQGSAEDPAIRNMITEWAIEPNSFLTIVVCNNDTSKAIATGIYLPPAIYSNSIPVFIQQSETNSLFTRMISGDIRYGNIRPFGMIEECFSLDTEMIETQAMLVKNTYDTYYSLRDKIYGKGLEFEDAIRKTLESPDPSPQEMQKRWVDTKIALRWANIYNANSIPIKIRAFGLDNAPLKEEDISLLAEVEHNRWNVERLLLGFRATTKTENNEIYANKSWKEIFKEKHMAHFDIRPYEFLCYDASGAKADEYDIVLSICFMKIIESSL